MILHRLWLLLALDFGKRNELVVIPYHFRRFGPTARAVRPDATATCPVRETGLVPADCKAVMAMGLVMASAPSRARCGRGEMQRSRRVSASQASRAPVMQRHTRRKHNGQIRGGGKDETAGPAPSICEC